MRDRLLEAGACRVCGVGVERVRVAGDLREGGDVLGGDLLLEACRAADRQVALDDDAPKLLHENLSDREYQVLCLIGSGKTVSQVAEALALSVKTVSTYRQRIYEKLGVESEVGLTKFALRQGLLADDV